MRSSKRAKPARVRVGRVSLYEHHGAWWIYYRDGRRQIRRKVGSSRADAEQVAAQVHGQLIAGAPTLLAFSPISVGELRQQFLNFHEDVLRSSVATIRRYRAATKYLEDYVNQLARPRKGT